MLALTPFRLRVPFTFRTYAKEAALIPPSPPPSPPDAPVPGQLTRTSVGLRPTYHIPVNPNHGLYAFFRKYEKDGVVQYDSLPVTGEGQLKTGRAWRAEELRRKSFRDLHTLWYVLLRERNLCATQIEEGRRMRISSMELGHSEVVLNKRKCRKSMARIKFVLNERRLMYEGALKIFAQQKAALQPSSTNGQQASDEQAVDARKDGVVKNTNVSQEDDATKIAGENG